LPFAEIRAEQKAAIGAGCRAQASGSASSPAAEVAGLDTSLDVCFNEIIDMRGYGIGRECAIVRVADLHQLISLK